MFRKKDDFRLYAISETYDGNGSRSTFYRFDLADNGSLAAEQVMCWNDSGEVNSYMDNGIYEIVCTIGENKSLQKNSWKM